MATVFVVGLPEERGCAPVPAIAMIKCWHRRCLADEGFAGSSSRNLSHWCVVICGGAHLVMRFIASMVVYSVLTGLLCLVWARVVRYARSRRMPPHLTAGVVVAAIVYCSCVIPGMFALLFTPVIYALCVAICVGCLLLIPATRDVPISSEPTLSGLVAFRLTVPQWILTGIGLLAVTPLLSHLRWSVIAATLNPNAGTKWDTVSYHLPGFIEFWQNHSLWSMEGQFQSYSFGFELIGNFLSHPFHTHWGLVLADVFAVFLLLAAILFVVRTLTEGLQAGADRLEDRWIPVAILAIGIWATVHTDSLGNVGKNDIFVTGCLVAALGFLLQMASCTACGHPNARFGKIMSSIALGLACAVKPTAMAFVPFFALAIGLLGARQGRADHRWRVFIFSAATVVMISLAMGGFWLARNLLVFGAISPLDSSWRLSLIANIHNPALYEIKRGSILFAAGVSAVIPGLYLLFVSRRNPCATLPLVLVMIFHVVACAAFAITPHAIFHHDLQTSMWKLRLGMPLFVSAALIYSLTISHVFGGLSRLTQRTQCILGLSMLGAILLVIPLYWRIVPPTGSAPYEVIRGLPRTGIYDWVKKQPSPLRIYSAGLRPYGLYGPQWKNTLRCDLLCHKIEPLSCGIERITSVVAEFRPDLVIISVDPEPYSDLEKPDVVEWLKQQSACFKEVYTDRVVTAFRVMPEAAARLRSRTLPSGGLEPENR